MKRILATIALLVFATGAFACTSVIITGKATKDGRPLIWKNTDGGEHFCSQRITYNELGKYAWAGLAWDGTPQSAWFGANEKGFVIMNTSSSNFFTGKKKSNGVIMKRALDVCVTLQDFVNLLDTVSLPKINVASHYGVIDAQGGAAYVEVKYLNSTKKLEYWVYDVNDPKLAPDGYMIYTNWSRNGEEDMGGGYIRYDSATKIFAEGYKTKEFTPKWIIDNLSRSYYNDLMGVDYRAMVDAGLYKGKGFIPDSDFIPRITTYAATVVQGVKKGENPLLTTGWTALGYAPTSVMIPFWVAGGMEGLNKIVRGNDNNHNDLKIGENNAIICDLSLKLKTQVFSVIRGHGPNYLNFSKLYNAEGTGYIQQLAPVEKEVYDLTTAQLEKWREKGKIDKKELAALNDKIYAIVMAAPVYHNDYTYKYGKIGKKGESNE